MKDEVSAGPRAIVSKKSLVIVRPDGAVDEGCHHEKAAEDEDGDREYTERPRDKVKLWVAVCLRTNWLCRKENMASCLLRG